LLLLDKTRRERVFGMVDAVLWILQSKMDQGVHGSFKQPL
jgi:hypothetical protein